jgi:hypothetical protein
MCAVKTLSRPLHTASVVGSVLVASILITAPRWRLRSGSHTVRGADKAAQLTTSSSTCDLSASSDLNARIALPGTFPPLKQLNFHAVLLAVASGDATMPINPRIFRSGRPERQRPAQPGKHEWSIPRTVTIRYYDDRQHIIKYAAVLVVRRCCIHLQVRRSSDESTLVQPVKKPHPRQESTKTYPYVQRYWGRFHGIVDAKGPRLMLRPWKVVLGLGESECQELGGRGDNTSRINKFEPWNKLSMYNHSEFGRVARSTRPACR